MASLSYQFKKYTVKGKPLSSSPLWMPLTDKKVTLNFIKRVPLGLSKENPPKSVNGPTEVFVSSFLRDKTQKILSPGTVPEVELISPSVARSFQTLLKESSLKM